MFYFEKYFDYLAFFKDFSKAASVNITYIFNISNVKKKIITHRNVTLMVSI